MTTHPAPRTSNALKILVRGVNWLGDAVMTTSALLRLREARPDAYISILTDAKLAGLWEHHPAVDAVLTFTNGESFLSLARRLRVEQFQIGLVLPNSIRSALELWRAGIPRRIGYAGQWRRWFLTDPVPARSDAVPMRKRSVAKIRQSLNADPRAASPKIPVSAHHIHQYLHLVGSLGARVEPMAPRVIVTREETLVFLERRQLTDASDRPLFGMNPGAEYGPAKRWPEERFVAAALEIQRRTRCRWVIFGGKSDVPLADRIAAGITGARQTAHLTRQASDDSSVLNLAGMTTLRELCAGLKACRLLLTNDTGPMHLAAAVGTPVIVPFGSTSPELTGPGLPGDSRNHWLRANVACSPCFLRECPIDFRCMNGISVEQVVGAVLLAFEAGG
jgi:heptosyltransferase-2